MAARQGASCGATATARSATGRRSLIVHSLVSRSYILDLRPGSSLVEYLVARRARRVHARLGRPGRARRRQRPRDVRRRLPAARLAARPARDRLPTRSRSTGYCLGGVLAALYAAGHDDAPVRNLVLMATPINFDEMGAMVAALREGRLNAEELRRRHRQRPGRRALQRLLHAGADDGGRPEGDAAREPVERRVRRGLPGDGPVVARPRAVSRRRVPRAGGGARAARTC